MVPTMSSSSAATALSYLASFASRDSAAIAAHVTDDFVNEHVSALGTGCVGRDEYERRLPDFLESFPDLAYHVEQVIDDGSAVAVAYRLTAAGDDRPVEMRGVMVFEIVDGLIRRRTDYWDSLGYLRQINEPTET
jgi:steroid delta-isomerase-like uncharacterized protein